MNYYNCIFAIDIARSYFAFEESPGMRFLAVNGLDYLHSLEDKIFSSSDTSNELAGSNLLEKLSPTSLLDALFIDVDCKDASSGVTAPPPAFVTQDVLQTMHRLLGDEGILVLNVAARDEAYMEEILTRLTKLFAQVYKLQPSEENLNIVVIGVKQSQVVDAKQRDALLDKWLKVSYIIRNIRNYLYVCRSRWVMSMIASISANSIRPWKEFMRKKNCRDCYIIVFHHASFDPPSSREVIIIIPWLLVGCRRFIQLRAELRKNAGVNIKVEVLL